ncbi:DUF4132 domain-containing protein [Catenuloplanes japonicus]|uniref:DUF4132 domain-containing protein n=1 Tax=Catenuloplanes japonicus TaxID=33876 RepID=UPI00068A0457|nr:DUF4132 domain-containing protein [Catenuloplanes japonicus]
MDVVLPEGWRPLPWRTDAETPVGDPVAPDPDAPAALAAYYAERPDLRATVLSQPETTPELAAADPESPLGAALTAFAHTDASDFLEWQTASARRAQLNAVLADAWLAGRGLAFAAEAAVLLFDLHQTGNRQNRDQPYAVEWQEFYGYYFRHDADTPLTVLYRVRDVLAAAPPEEYRDAVAAVARVRAERDSVQRRAVSAVLVPAARDWTAAALDELAVDRPLDEYHYGINRRIATLLAAACTPEQARRLLFVADDMMFHDPGHRLISTVLTHAPEAAATLLRGTGWHSNLTVLARTPYDDAFTELRDRVLDRDIRPYLVEAADRFPERATRLLAEAGGRRVVGDLLRGHVVAHPAEAATALPSLTGAAATRVAAVLDEIAARTEAKPDAVPSWPALPTKRPPVPPWMLVGVLPPLLKDGTALPGAYVPALLTAFGLSRVNKPWEHLGDVIGAFDRTDLARYVWDVFFRWYFLGGTAKESWTLDALGLAGDDDTIRRLTPTILAWPGESGHARAVAGLGVLAAIGTEEALMALNRIAQRAGFKGLKNAARQKMDEVAAGLGLTGAQLADRLLPDLGLDEGGRTVIDYGPRTFTVVFDETLTPHVTDATGRRLKALPKPGAKDDADRAPAEQKRFAELKKEARRVGTDLVARLERDMVSGRRLTGAEFVAHYATHPLARHAARRLVWGVYDEADTLTSVLRVAEDGTLADDHDDPVTLPADARVGVAHPIHLAAHETPIGEVFADYEILQPFAQLHREVYRLTPEEAAGTLLPRLTGRTAPYGRVLGLEKRGWLRDNPQDAGIIGSFGYALPGGGTVEVELSPGMSFYERDEDQDFQRVRLTGRGTLGEVDEVIMSEIIRDLVVATA